MSQTTEPAEWRIEKWFPEIPANQIAQLQVFHSELIKFNGKINLISPRTEKHADLIHIADGIIATRIVLEKTTQSVIHDLGSGNGIPGLIMAVLAPDRQIHLVDADSRKCEFIKHAAGKAGLRNVIVSQERVEDLGENSIHCATTRGLAAIAKTLVLMRKCAAPGCEVYHMKSDAWSTEIASIPSQVFAFWSAEHLVDYKLPESDVVYSVVLTSRK